MDGRTLRSVRDKPAWQHAWAFFDFAYYNLAETLAEGEATPEEEDPDAGGEEAAWDFTGASHPAQPIPAALADRPQRWLAPTTLAELYDTYRVWNHEVATESLACFSVFRRCWKSAWQGLLRVRRVSQHSRCEDRNSTQSLMT